MAEKTSVVMSTTATAQEETSPTRVRSYVAVVFFWVSHTAAVYSSKALLTSPGETLHMVVLLTWGQCVFSSLLLLALGALGKNLEDCAGGPLPPGEKRHGGGRDKEQSEALAKIQIHCREHGQAKGTREENEPLKQDEEGQWQEVVESWEGSVRDDSLQWWISRLGWKRGWGYQWVGVRRALVELSHAIPADGLLSDWNSQSLQGAGDVAGASALFSLAVFADNACLMVVNTSFFQVARGLTLPLVTVLGVLATGRCPPGDLLIPSLLCLCGFAMGASSQPWSLHEGTALGALSSLLTALYTLLLARTGPGEGWRMTYMTNRNASLMLVPAAVYLGLGNESVLYGMVCTLSDLKMAIIAGMATTLPAIAGVATLWQANTNLGGRAQALSSLGRAAFSHLLAFLVWGNSPVVGGEMGCCLVLMGLAIYSSQRGGVAVAQAGQVAIPAAARAHLLYPSPESDKTVSMPSKRRHGCAGPRQCSRSPPTGCGQDTVGGGGNIVVGVRD